jgi:predicted HTH domain antitoxin
MSLVISDQLLETSGMNETEFMREIAIMLFQQNKISLGKASELANMHRVHFQKLLADRNINVHYKVEDLDHEITGLKARGWL